MRVQFCETSRDITIFLLEGEINELRGSTSVTPVLSVECKGRNFSVMNPKSAREMSVIEPRDEKNFPYWTVRVNDNSYESLIRDGRCGTRYGMTSKVSVQKEIDK